MSNTAKMPPDEKQIKEERLKLLRRIKLKTLSSSCVDTIFSRMYPRISQFMEKITEQADLTNETLVVSEEDWYWTDIGFEELSHVDCVFIQRYYAAKRYPITLTSVGLIVPPEAKLLAPVTAKHLSA